MSKTFKITVVLSICLMFLLVACEQRDETGFVELQKSFDKVLLSYMSLADSMQRYKILYKHHKTEKDTINCYGQKFVVVRNDSIIQLSN